MGSGSAHWLGIGLHVCSFSADLFGIGLYVRCGTAYWLAFFCFLVVVQIDRKW